MMTTMTGDEEFEEASRERDEACLGMARACGAFAEGLGAYAALLQAACEGGGEGGLARCASEARGLSDDAMACASPEDAGALAEGWRRLSHGASGIARDVSSGLSEVSRLAVAADEASGRCARAWRE